jgi:hypothetical protein
MCRVVEPCGSEPFFVLHVLHRKEFAVKFQGAVIKEQGVTFAVVIVKPHVVSNQSEANEAIWAFQPAFPGLPVILMAQNARGVPTYFGRQDIARFMAKVPLSAVPWKEYTVG